VALPPASLIGGSAGAMAMRDRRATGTHLSSRSIVIEQVYDRRMSFGQVSGPPATAKQVNELLSLLNEAGHSDFRDARGPMGFTQRQAGGKFSRDEADAFIAQLQEEAEQQSAAEAPAAVAVVIDDAVRKLPTEQLAAELQRRGWIVAAP
jgi:hypothetical protein